MSAEHDPAPKGAIRSVTFRQQREATWQELERILAQIDNRGLSGASAEDLARLPMLYRATLSALNVARAISLDRNVLEYLENLSTRAYLRIYSTRRSALSVVSGFVARDLPGAVWQLRRQVAMSSALVAMAAAVAAIMVLQDPERFYAFVDQAYAQGRGPLSTNEELRAIVFSGAEHTGDDLAYFSGHLMTHNAKIGLLAFTLGVGLGLPTIYLLFTNGLTLGAFVGLYLGRGMGVEFFSWLLPHGVTELLAVILCGAAGLAIGDALAFPGAHSRLDHLKLRARVAGPVVVGAIGLFVLAGLIEGFFRQMVHDVSVRYVVVVATSVLWIIYFGVWGPRAADARRRLR